MKEINTPIEGVKVLQFGTTFYAVYKLDDSRWQAQAIKASNKGWVWQSLIHTASTYDHLLVKLCEYNDTLLISHVELVVNYNHTETMSTPLFLNSAIWLVKSSVAIWNLPAENS